MSGRIRINLASLRYSRVTPGELLIIEDESGEGSLADDYAREKAKELVAQGLSDSLRSQIKTPEEVWLEFETIRAKIHGSIGSKSNQPAAAAGDPDPLA